MTGWIGTKDAAAYVGIKPKVLERLCKNKRFPHGKLGRRYRFRTDVIDRFLSRKGFDGTITTRGAGR